MDENLIGQKFDEELREQRLDESAKAHAAMLNEAYAHDALYDTIFQRGWEAGMLEALQGVECCGDIDERIGDLYEYVETGVFPDRDEDGRRT